MAPPSMTSIATIICFGLLPVITLASQQATLTQSSPSYYNIHKSHIFHVEPNAVVNSVLSNIPRQPCRPLLDIDVSSIKLDDDAVVSLIEGILNAQDGTSETVVSLKLEMNRISPVGLSKVFDLLVGESDDKVEETKKAVDVMSSSTEAASAEGNNVTVHAISSEETINATIDDEVETNIQDAVSDEESIPTTSIDVKPKLRIESLDLSYNDIGGEGINPPSAQLLNSVRRLFENRDNSITPNTLLMENCGIGAAFCRSIGRGILNAYERNRNQSETCSKYEGRPSILRIGGNPAIGDAGAVALAAAFRMAKPDDTNGDGAIIKELDLSSCNIGDVGAEALALALACNPSSMRRLDLSNNKITDTGAIALGRALIESREQTSGFALDQIILDNNALIGDDGAAALAKALSAGAVRSIHLRSCSIRAEGATEFGKALVELAKHFKTRQMQSAQIEVDISGNAFGISKPKKKKGAAYSASLLRDKASSNIRSIGKSLQSRMKGAGFGMGLTTVESDDDEEEMGHVMGDILSDDEDVEEFDSDRLKAISRCGARLFSSEILKAISGGSFRTGEDTKLEIFLGMRQCFLDDGAIDALAAAKVCARKADTTLSIDTTMNTGIDDALILALNGDGKEELLLSSADRHTNEMKRISEAEERREAAAEVAAARVHDRFVEDDLFDDYDYDDEY